MTKRAVSAAVRWQPIERQSPDSACEPFNGRCYLVRAGDDMAVARFDGERFVFPASSGIPLDFEPTEFQP